MKRIEDDDLAVIGSDTMIIFIAMVMLSSVIGAMMFNVVDLMAQQTQHTAYDATKEAATQVIFIGGWVEDGYDDYLFMIEYQSQGKNVAAADIDFMLYCTDAGNFYYRSGVLGTWISGNGATIWEVGSAPGSVTELESGKRYFFGIDAGTNDFPGGNHCGPNFINQRDMKATLMINLPDGGVSTQELYVPTLEVGAPVI